MRRSKKNHALVAVGETWERDVRARKVWAVKNPATDPVLEVRSPVSREPSQKPSVQSRPRTETKPDGWPAGKYKLEVFLNGSSAATREVEVEQ
jgi:hypothetical protein